MARPGADQELTASVLDRLIDLEPGVSTEPEGRRHARVSELKASVRRDLEWLLNSRRVVVDVPASMPQLRESVLTFGLPDFTNYSLENPVEREGLQHAIADAIRRFEPRLIQVSVALVEGQASERSLRFRIDAALDVDPVPETVSFDSILEMPTRAIVVKGE